MGHETDIDGSLGRLARLARILDHVGHLLPAQAPLEAFVHHNTLHGLQHLPFADALARAEASNARRGYLPERRFRQLYAEGRIREEDLRAALAARPGLDPDAALAEIEGRTIRRGDVLLRALIDGWDRVDPGELAWRLEEEGVLAGHEALWQDCLDAFGLSRLGLHPETLMDLPEDLVTSLLVRFRAEDGEDAVTAQALSERMAEDARAEVDRLFDAVGHTMTARGLLLALTGQDLLDAVAAPFLRVLAAHLDEGVAAWHAPDRADGLYASWRRMARSDLGLDLTEAPSWRPACEALPDDPLQAIEAELDHLGVPEDRWEGYLTRLALELPGWMGMVRWREEHPEHRASRGAPARLSEALAIRLFLDAQHLRRVCMETWRVDGRLPIWRAWLRSHPAEALVRLALYSGELPDHLAHRVRTLAEDPWADPRDREPWRGLADMIWTWRQSPVAPELSGPSVYRDAWPLFLLARALGLRKLTDLVPHERGALMAAMGALSAKERAIVWLQAYERPYREALLTALDANRRAPLPSSGGDALPQAQVICCIDDREEGFRRHLEEVLPELETYGVAGFFGLAMRYRGLDDAHAVALCPANLTPVTELAERARPGAEGALARRARGRGWRASLGRLGQAARRRLLLGHALVDLLAPALALALPAKILAPLRWGAASDALRRALEPPVRTQIALERAPDPTLRQGLTDEAQAEAVAALLTNIGLTERLAPLVLLLGHGSASVNNPYRAAYDCGACGGRHGGPNARAVAGMANRPAVRRLLSARGLRVPETTWFLGAEHNTATEAVDFYDLEDMPERFAPLLQALREGLQRAGQQHAHERCRRLASAPRAATPAEALRHVLGRTRDLGQTRPELGHATVAAAIVGRRAMTRGLFLDRRAFLVSYDPTRDPQGQLLARILSSVVPVGAGIALEYYFSTSNDTGYGSGTKAAHNVSGLVGVLDGAAGDLRTGLPRQMTEIHEAMRLLMVVEARPEVLSAIAERDATVGALVLGGWVQLAAMTPEEGALYRLVPGEGWLRWEPTEAPARTGRSADWYTGKDGHLPPALLGGARV